MTYNLKYFLLQWHIEHVEAKLMLFKIQEINVKMKAEVMLTLLETYNDIYKL